MKIIKAETRMNTNTYAPEVVFTGVLDISVDLKATTENIDDHLYYEIGKDLIDQISALSKK